MASQAVDNPKSANPPAKRVRDPRLDFFRGVAMLIIFVAHVPGNIWSWFIPARFGASDAAEMFVFCSGFAAAIAYGGSFARAGFWAGTARVVHRIFTLYIAHIMLFLAVAILVYIASNVTFLEKDYISGLALNPFFRDPGQQLVGLFTLTYVPNYFDIMPMYMGVLALMPLIILFQRAHTALAYAFVIILYALQWNLQWDFPAAPFNEKYVWFFNPLGWQLLFFTGFFLSRGWLKPPPINPLFIGIAIAIVILGYVTGNWNFMRAFPEFKEFRDLIKPYVLGKTDFGLLRYAHFLALAYLCVALLKGREQILFARIFDPIRKVGQQALATFLFSMFLSRVAGMAIDYFGKDSWVVSAINIVGLSLVIGLAYLVGWFKSDPWRKPAPSTAQANPKAQSQGSGSGFRTAAAE